jgi:hypothetical protein
MGTMGDSGGGGGRECLGGANLESDKAEEQFEAVPLKYHFAYLQ